ncbi:MAG: cytochrome P450, partial [Flavobacteriales bacterium]
CVWFSLGPRRAYFFHHPDAVEQILVTEAKALKKDLFTRQLKHSLGDGLLTIDGDRWKRRRRIAAPTLTKRQIERYADGMVEVAEQHALAWEDGQRVDMHHEMMALTLRIVARTLFDTQIDADVERFGAAMENVMAYWDAELNSWRRFLPAAVPTPGRLAVRKPLHMLDDMIRRVIAEKRAARVGGDDLISRLLAASTADGQALSDQDLLDEAKTFFAAGHETTAIALSMAFYFISQHPEAALALDEELRQVLDGRRPTLDDVAALRYTDAIIRETLRLHPPAWILGRENTVPLTVCGVRVPAKSQLLVSAFALHRDARWFREPDAFSPERWFSDVERPRFAYLPFGGGSRVCIGNHFALMEATLVFATLWQRWSATLDPGYRLERLAAITMRPRHGVPVTLHARDGH